MSVQRRRRALAAGLLVALGGVLFARGPSDGPLRFACPLAGG